MGQMSANIRAKGVATVAQLTKNGLSPQNLKSLLRSAQSVVTAFEQMDANHDGRLTIPEIFNYETDTNTPLGDCLAYTKAQMHLGVAGEDISLIPGVSLATLMKDQPGFNLTSAFMQTNTPIQGIIYSRIGSPDGTIWLHPGDGTPAQEITTGEWPRLSQDGEPSYLSKRGNAEFHQCGPLAA